MIINTSEVKHIYLANNYVDLRNSIDGLALIVSMQFDLDVMDGSIFIFTNRARNRLKILYYENNGFWLFLKRLEHGRFRIHEDNNSDTRLIDQRQLRWLLDGLEIEQKFAHKSVKNRLLI